MTLQEPFVHLRHDGRATTVGGRLSFLRGHQIARGGGEAPDGIYLSWRVEGDRLEVRNDRYGASPAFYWADDRQICVSPSLLAVLQRGAPTGFDVPGLAAFLRLGYFLGDDTPFAAIRTLPPGAVLAWQRGGMMLSAARPAARVSCHNRDAAIDGFIALCRQSIRRRLPDGDGIVMPLSSGRDSRHLLYELCAAGVRPRCVTMPRYAPRPPEDQRIAPLVAGALRLPHTVLRQNPSRCDAEVRKNWITHLCADEHAWYVEIAAQLAGSARTMYDGLGGALSVPNRYHSFAALELMAQGRTRALAEQLIADYGVQSEPFLRAVLRRGAYAAMSRDCAVERLARELDTHVDAPDPIKSFNFWNRNRRELALWAFAVLREVPQVYAPYLDQDLFDFLIGLPPTVMSPTLTDGKAFHTDAINRAFPQHADVPFENKKAPRIDARTHNARLAAEASRYILRHTGTATRLLDRRYVIPRALCAAARPSLGATRPWLSLVSLYLTQLEMAAAGCAPPVLAACDDTLAAAA